MITSADVITRVAALGATEIAPSEWTAVIADAYLQINADRFGSRTSLAAIYLVAHSLSLSHPWLLQPGPINSEGMRNTRYGYAVPMVQAMEQLDTTPFGREFKRIRSQLGFRGLLT